ncbi:MAG: gliding motility-associated-like protein [Cryomorphaceae bacterium]|jgi:gliding motility-associated-like protein
MKFKSYLLIPFLSFVFLQNMDAQVNVIDTFTVEELVNDFLLGAGVTATNITFNGNPADQVYLATGLYQGGESSNVVGFEEGVLICTDGAFDLVVNGNGNNSTGNFQDDPDLLAISGQSGMNNCAIIEFDFVVSSDSVRFNYVFASEEYPGFTCSGFNDAFGFFISGPGISGEFTDNAKNIALIPDTDIPVAINTVNSGVSSSGNNQPCDDANPNWQEDSIYFVDNENEPSGEVQLAGMTVTLSAQEAVQCGEEYHIKLAIGNALDQSLDSGVFLEAGSFSAFGEIFAEFSPVFNNGGDVDQEGYDSLVVAGCTSPVIELIRPPGATFISIDFVLQGNAEEGVDYVIDGEIPNGFPEGVDTVAFAIETINPNITDTLFFELLIIYETCAGVTDTTILEIPIAPPPQILTTTNDVDVFCPTDSLVIEVEASNGLLPYTYDWEDLSGDIDGAAILVALPDIEQDFVVEVTDACAFVFVTDTVTVTNSVPPPLDVSIDTFADPTCPNEPVSLQGSVLNGNPPYIYVWNDSRGNTYGGFDNITTSDINPAVVIFTPTLDVVFTVIDSCGTSVRDSVMINYPIYDSLSTTFGPLVDNCPEGPVELDAEVVGGAGDLTYLWGISEGESTFTTGFGSNSKTTFIDAGSGFNTFTLLVRDRCNVLGQDMFIADQGGELLYTGRDTEEIEVPYIKLDPLPNIITPNGDGQNEVFVVPGIDVFEDASVLIYDRWGKLIYENSSYDAGTGEATVSQGFSADGFSDGTYVYIINIDSGECVTQGSLQVIDGSE